MKKILLITAVALLVSVVPAKAQWTVFDPANFSEAVREYVQDFNQAQTLSQQYSFWQNQIQQIINMPQRYQALLSQWRQFATLQDFYHNTGGWSGAANSGSNVSGAYAATTNALSTYPGKIFAAMSPDAQARVMSRVATIELRDGANQVAMQEFGQVRANGQQAAQQLSNLQNDSYGGQLSTQLQVAQKTNAAVVTQAQLQTDTNRLLVSVAEQQVLESKAKRDEEATAIATDSQAKSQGPAFAQSSWAGAGQALDSYNPVR